MLDIKFLRTHLTEVQNALATRGDTTHLNTFIESDNRRRQVLLEVENLKHRRNVVSEEIAALKKQGKDAETLVLEMREVSAKIKEMDKDLSEIEAKANEIIMVIPNVPHSSVPVGTSEKDNPEVRRVGEPRKFDFEAKAHWDIGEALGILDLERATKLTGARFPLYFGAGARLERALINFMLDIHTSENGYTEILPPFMVNRDTMTGTGQLPKFEEDLFKLDKWDYFLVPTAEVPLTNIHKSEILDEDKLPLYFTAYTPCFRSEAGSYGKDTRGLIRQHQFNKVELVKLCTPETSYSELEKMLNNATGILERLKLPYRVITLCTGDMGFSAAKTYDIEVWIPAQNTYREISSCSNCEDFQARRANLRFRRKGKKGTELVHTLNGSGLAVGRTFLAILENYQEADGSVIIPEVLRPYMGGMEKIVKP